MKPPHLCTCGKIVAHGTRCTCQVKQDRERKARFDQTRPSARKRGYTAEWQLARSHFLARHPLCKMCQRPASLVDHIMPHKGDPILFWDRTNWQPLCFTCHNSTKQRQERNT